MGRQVAGGGGIKKLGAIVSLTLLAATALTACSCKDSDVSEDTDRGNQFFNEATTINSQAQAIENCLNQQRPSSSSSSSSGGTTGG